MRKYLWPIIVIALALVVAGAWVLFPEERTAVSSTLSSFCSSSPAKDSRIMLPPISVSSTKAIQ